MYSRVTHDVNFRFVFISCLIFIEKHLQDSETFYPFFVTYLCVFVFFNLLCWGIFIYTKPGGGEFIVCIRAIYQIV